MLPGAAENAHWTLQLRAFCWQAMSTKNATSTTLFLRVMTERTLDPREGTPWNRVEVGEEFMSWALLQSCLDPPTSRVERWPPRKQRRKMLNKPLMSAASFACNLRTPPSLRPQRSLLTFLHLATLLNPTSKQPELLTSATVMRLSS